MEPESKGDDETKSLKMICIRREMVRNKRRGGKKPGEREMERSRRIEMERMTHGCKQKDRERHK